MSLLELIGFVSEGIVDRVFEVGHLLEAADGDVMLFDVVPDGFNARLLGDSGAERPVPRAKCARPVSLPPPERAG